MAKLDFLKTDGFKLTKRLDLGGFNAALAGQYLDVWLNLDAPWWGDWQRQVEMTNDYTAWLDEEQKRIAALPSEERDAASAAFNAEMDARMDEFLDFSASIRARLWGCTTEEARAIYEVSVPLYSWATDTAIDLVLEYRGIRKKDSPSTSPG